MAVGAENLGDQTKHRDTTEKAERREKLSCCCLAACIAAARMMTESVNTMLNIHRSHKVY